MLYTAHGVNKYQSSPLKQGGGKKPKVTAADMAKGVDFGLMFHDDKCAVDTRGGPGVLRDLWLDAAS